METRSGGASTLAFASEMAVNAASSAVALAPPIEARDAALVAAITGWVPAPNDGGAALKVALADWLADGFSVGAAKVNAE